MVGEVVDRTVVMDLGSMLAIGTFNEVMDNPAVRRGLPGPDGGVVTRIRTAASGDVLLLEHVSAAYGPYRALFDVSFSVPAGGIVALVGSNGAGKSTVARVVSGLVDRVVGKGRPLRPRRHRPAGLQDRPAAAWRTWSRGGASSPA